MSWYGLNPEAPRMLTAQMARWETFWMVPNLPKLSGLAANLPVCHTLCFAC